MSLYGRQKQRAAIAGQSFQGKMFCFCRADKRFGLPVYSEGAATL
ncbi:hypothetical protein AALA00_12455 [Lachnospiraceae bacterium 46-15]